MQEDKNGFTGIPNKNRCEEILNNPEPIPDGELVAMCVFDFNNLRTINNNLGHDGGDEFIAVLKGIDHNELFRFADKNMYIDKNRAKMEEAAAKQKMNIQILENINAQGYAFSSCMCCDALLDQYYVLRAGSKFFLADDGSYSGAVEQIIQELSTEENRKNLRRQLQIEYLSEHLTKDSGNHQSERSPAHKITCITAGKLQPEFSGAYI